MATVSKGNYQALNYFVQARAAMFAQQSELVTGTFEELMMMANAAEYDMPNGTYRYFGRTYPTWVNSDYERHLWDQDPYNISKGQK